MLSEIRKIGDGRWRNPNFIRNLHSSELQRRVPQPGTGSSGGAGSSSHLVIKGRKVSLTILDFRSLMEDFRKENFYFQITHQILPNVDVEINELEFKIKIHNLPEDRLRKIEEMCTKNRFQLYKVRDPHSGSKQEIGGLKIMTPETTFEIEDSLSPYEIETKLSLINFGGAKIESQIEKGLELLITIIEDLVPNLLEKSYEIQPYRRTQKEGEPNLLEQLIKEMKQKPPFKVIDGENIIEDISNIGLDPELKQKLLFFIESIKGEVKNDLAEWGLEPERRILLWGPPGTGKSLIARIVAKEIESGEKSLKKLLYVSGGTLGSIYVSGTTQKVFELFNSIVEEIKKGNTIVLFIDEIDTIFPEREKAHEERGSALGEFLQRLDGIQQLGPNFYLLVATNKLNLLDKALIRDGRFDERWYIGAQGPEGRKKTFQVHMNRLQDKANIYAKENNISPRVLFASDCLTDSVVKEAEGLTGAEIKAIVEEVVRLKWLEHNQTEVKDVVATEKDFLDVIAAKKQQPKNGLGSGHYL